jgi:hypothetical protein
MNEKTQCYNVCTENKVSNRRLSLLNNIFLSIEKHDCVASIYTLTILLDNIFSEYLTFCQ